MKLVSCVAALALATVAALGAQERSLVVSVYGGGADHLADLQSTPAAYFMPGYNVGASVGVQLNRHFAVHGDFTYTRNPARGASSFAGNDVNRFFYGAHFEARYPLGAVAPFLFIGGGAVTIDQVGIDQFPHATRAAAMYGGGLFYAIPHSRFELFGEVKGLTYRWDLAGFNRMMYDVTYSGGLSYRLPF